MADKIHKQHPKCDCGRPLFKSWLKGGRVIKTDPYKFCRNVNCPRSGQSGVVSGAEPTTRSKPAKQPLEQPKGPPVRARVSRAKSRPKPSESKPTGEHPGIVGARSRIRDLVKSATDGAPKSAIGLVLALVTQETGNKAAANLLIQEHKLDELFGLQAQ